MNPVVAPLAGYRDAIAELPLTARLTHDKRGAVVVVPGAGWVDASVAASAAGAAAIVVAEPEAVGATEVRRLARIVEVPVILDRSALREDVVRAAVRDRQGSPPRVLTADGAAHASRLPAVVRDAAGWLRVLAGDPLSVRSSDGGLALLSSSAGIPATLSVAAVVRGAGWIRAQALGEVLTDVEIEAGSTRISTSSRAGRLVAPALYESSERLALRRALASLASGSSPSDLADILIDTELAEDCLRPLHP